MRRDVATTLAARVLMVVAGLGASIVTARALGPAGRGEYVFVVTLNGIVVQLANLGLHSSNTYLAADRRSLLRPLLANSLWVSLGLGTAAAVLAAVVVDLGSLFPATTPTGKVWFVILLAPPSLFFLLGVNLLLASGRIRAFNAFEAGSSVAAVVGLLAAAAAGGGIALFLLGSAAAWWVVAAALVAALAGRRLRGLRFRRDVFALGFRYAAKAYVVAVLGFLVLRANVFLLGRLAGPKEIGTYSVASQVADVLGLVPTSAAIVLFPALVRDRARSWSSTVRTALGVALVLVPACAVAGAVAGPAVRVVFGAGFEPAAGILRWMLPGVLAFGIASVVSQHLAAAGLPRVTIWVWVAGLAAVVAFGRLLIPTYGATGAGISYSLTYGLVLLLVTAAALRLREPPAGAPPVELPPETEVAPL